LTIRSADAAQIAARARVELDYEGDDAHSCSR
jgi:hypothetical protein